MDDDLRYFRAETLDEALDFLWRNGPETAILAGGTDLLVELREGNLRCRHILDVSCIPGLKSIHASGTELHLGSCVTFSEIASSPEVQHLAPVLKLASRTIGSLQIRNVATIGGNVATSSPAGDSLPALLVHDARVVLGSLHAQRTVPLVDFLLGPYENARRPQELVIRLVLHKYQAAFHDFQKVGRRRELVVARLNLAVLAHKDGNGRISDLRVALGSATPMPVRIAEVERLLIGQVPSETLFWEAGGVLSRKMVEMSGRRPSTAYKERAVQGLLVRTLCPLLDDGKAKARMIHH
jgi:CO/xanthine dehydrogenase FAD-binding subunit